MLNGETAKMFEHEKLQVILDTIDPLLADGDRYKQRSGAELLAGLSRGEEEVSFTAHREVILNFSRREALAQAACGPFMGMDHRSSRPYLRPNET